MSASVTLSTPLRADPLPSAAPSELPGSLLGAARRAQRRWSATHLEHRLRCVGALRQLLAACGPQLAATVEFPGRKDIAETLAAEIIPLADACRFLQREAGSILRPRKVSTRSRPIWLRRVQVELAREPLGVVLIVGASNYPLMISGVQTLQAVTAGNAVLLKPGRAATRATRALARMMVDAGFPRDLVTVLPESTEVVRQSIERGVDKVVLTGGARAGRAVQRMLAESLTPSIMELSGCDAVFVLKSADLKRVAAALAFGMTFNGGATCIAPRRIFVPREMVSELETCLQAALSPFATAPVTGVDEQAAGLVHQALQEGARLVFGGVCFHERKPRLKGVTVLSDPQAASTLLSTEVFAPVATMVPVASLEQALKLNARCPYALGATVFGAEQDARRFAHRVPAGCVVINDMIAPTADPRVPFGGRQQSGFGVTRGADGLREMTQVKAVVTQRSRWLPHFAPSSPHDADLLSGYLGFAHGHSLWYRLRSLNRVVQAARAQLKWQRPRHPHPGRNLRQGHG